MIEKYLLEKYSKYLKGLSIYENKTSLILSKIIINDETRNEGIGTKILNDLIDYADKNKQIIALTPSSDYGGNKNRLIQFYKKFGFKHNKGQYKSFEFRDSMIRYPKMNETKNIIQKLLREALDKKITCSECGWDWKESESSKNDLYICHKCGNDNNPKQTLKEGVMKNNKVDAKIIADFVNFTKEYLGIDDDIKVALAFERTPDITTTAYYDLKGFIKIYVKDRAIMDICRSIAHEFVHHKQNLDGRLVDAVKDGQDGTDIENEANAVAGVIIRKWGKLHPELYS